MWTKRKTVTTLLVLFFGGQTSFGDNGAATGELEAQLQEAVVARNVAEQRCAELKVSLSQARKDLEALRARYAELLVVSGKREAETEQLRLEIVKTLYGANGRQPDDLTVKAVRALRDSHAANAALHKGVRAFAEYLPGVVEALEPSAVIRREIGEKLDQLVQLTSRAERLPSSVAGRGGKEDRSRRECRVLAVSDEYQTVILDAGALDGVRLGMLWSVYNREGQLTHLLRVVEARETISAAMIIKGHLDSVAPGTLARNDGAGDQ
ncbi:MAG: hypothetical protein RRC34_02165 [Lentisphaeria bacterium]|nr:hypothetical protein [Lentisphaeria bacterium]